MFCKNCGTPMDNGAAFCPTCGCPVNDQPQQPAFRQQPAFTPQDQRPMQQPIQPTQQPVQMQMQMQTSSQNGYQSMPQSAKMRREQAYAQAKANGQGMAWYKFIIYFQLIASGLSWLLSGIQSFMGGGINVSYGGNKADIEYLYEYFPNLRSMMIIFGVLYCALAVFAFYTHSQIASFKKNGPVTLMIFYISSFIILAAHYIGLAMMLNLTFEATVYISFTSYAVMITCTLIYMNKRKHLFIY